MARWDPAFEEFTYTIENRPGVRMKHVDALSRFLVMVITATTNISPQIRKAQEKDVGIKLITEILKEKP